MSNNRNDIIDISTIINNLGKKYELKITRFRF